MSKRSRPLGRSSGKRKSIQDSLSAQNDRLDPTLASLFANSSGPLNVPPAVCYSKPHSRPDNPEIESHRVAKLRGPIDLLISEKDSAQNSDSSDTESSGRERLVDSELSSEPRSREDSSAVQQLASDDLDPPQTSIKRKRDYGEDIEDTYMRKLARVEARENEKISRSKSIKSLPSVGTQSISSEGNEFFDGSNENEQREDDHYNRDDSDIDSLEVPRHETIAGTAKSPEVEKANRTVFLGNVSTQAIKSKSAKKALLHHLASFIASLPTHESLHRIESIRFRSTPYSPAIPKKAAYARKELVDTTTKSTNAYVVYSTQEAAREAAKRLNGTVVLDRHLRVDEIANPSQVDHRRCVFVGNLGFVDDDSLIQEAEEANNKRKSRKRDGDVEEGLWCQFSKAGKVESVRVIRDPKTRVSKGVAYVQFKDENSVEAALLFNDKKFPPLLPRAIRVTRARGFKRRELRNKPNSYSGYTNPNGFKSKPVYGNGFLEERAGKLLGKAQAAQLYRTDGPEPTNGRSSHPIRKPEDFIFEGHRASRAQGKSGLKLGGSGRKKRGINKNRSTKRAAAWKASGGKGSK